jgi:hypothetical protein
VWEEPRLGFENNNNNNKLFYFIYLFDIKNLENSPEISKFSQISKNLIAIVRHVKPLQRYIPGKYQVKFMYILFLPIF